MKQTNPVVCYGPEYRKKQDFTEGFNQNAEGLKWGDDHTIWFISDWHATDEIYSLDISTGKINKHTEGTHNYTSVIPAETLIATKVSMSKPAEIYRVDPKTGKKNCLSSINPFWTS